MKPGAFFAALAAVALLAACGGASYTSDYDPNADFTAYHTFQWADRPQQGRDDPRVYNNITASRIRTAVERALAEKGFEAVTDNNPDFWVAWHGAIEGKMSTTTMNSGYGGWYGYGWYGPSMSTGISTTSVNEWDEGTVVLDIIDGERRELVWRASVTDVIDESNRPPEETQARFDEGARKLLETFPPGS